MHQTPSMRTAGCASASAAISRASAKPTSRQEVCICAPSACCRSACPRPTNSGRRRRSCGPRRRPGPANRFRSTTRSEAMAAMLRRDENAYRIRRFLPLILIVTVTVRTGAGQPPSPRTPDGHPDFQGTYSFDTLTPLERPAEFAGKPFLNDAEARDHLQRRLAGRPQPLDYDEVWLDRPETLLRVNGRYPTSRIVDPSDGRIPELTPAARQRVAAASERLRKRLADGPEDRSLPERCLSPAPMITTGGEANFLQIVQTPNHIVVYTELMGVRRIIPIGGTLLPASIRSRTGISRGQWDGDTLVVETTNFRGPYGFAFAAIDEGLHLMERFSRMAAGTLLYEATIDDPTAFVKPWTFVLAMRRTNSRLFEFACHEGNYALANILTTARMEERENKR